MASTPPWCLGRSVCRTCYGSLVGWGKLKKGACVCMCKCACVYIYTYHFICCPQKHSLYLGRVHGHAATNKNIHTHFHLSIKITISKYIMMQTLPCNVNVTSAESMAMQVRKASKSRMSLAAYMAACSDVPQPVRICWHVCVYWGGKGRVFVSYTYIHYILIIIFIQQRHPTQPTSPYIHPTQPTTHPPCAGSPASAPSGGPAPPKRRGCPTCGPRTPARARWPRAAPGTPGWSSAGRGRGRGGC